ncbi:hypothetical protein NDU88_003398 [Pleurodeles waltl]|uniref:Uncharacterized protein n=1 Tax=Pleurodeles waltl TaxID=8319 RepID=A0AAV7UYB5_PLEWA|nr:hypothetical protein NDU88_003398 [Pleurodeles waltl]
MARRPINEKVPKKVRKTGKNAENEEKRRRKDGGDGGDTRRRQALGVHGEKGSAITTSRQRGAHTGKTKQADSKGHTLGVHGERGARSQQAGSEGHTQAKPSRQTAKGTHSGYTERGERDHNKQIAKGTHRQNQAGRQQKGEGTQTAFVQHNAEQRRKNKDTVQMHFRLKYCILDGSRERMIQ